MTPGQRRETSGVTTRLIVRYVRSIGGNTAVDSVVTTAGITRSVDELEDGRSWTTYDEKVALFAAAAAVLGDGDVARRIGERVLTEELGLAVRSVLWALGSPAQVLRNIARTCHRFSTVAEMACLEVGRGRAVITYRLHDGFTPSRFDCDYTRGLLSQTPALFGLPPASITHEHCQVRGDASCTYMLAWPAGRRLFNRGRRGQRRLEAELGTMVEQLEALQRAAADLVGADDLQTVLRHIATRARAAIDASGYVLVVRPIVGGAPTVHADGLLPEEVDELSAMLLDGGPPPHPSRLVVDVASARRHYGKLLAVHPGNQGFFPEERRVLVAYGALAAAALETVVERETAALLLDLGRTLAELTSTGDVCQRVADAIPPVVGAPLAGVALWDAAREEVVFSGVHGLDPTTERALLSLVVHPSDTPELLESLSVPGPRYYTSGTDDAFIRIAMGAFGVDAVAVVPMMVRGDPLGFVIAGWPTPPGAGLSAELVDRMTGLAGQAVTALQNARLIEQTTHQALHDPLTGLPNRSLLDDRMQQAAARARRDGSLIGVLLVDLDGFKAVNDTLGHHAGDAVLREVARRLASVLRDVDTAARFGGDEFVLVLQAVRDTREVDDVARRVEEALIVPIDVGSALVTIGASVGVTCAPGDDGASRVEALLAAADAAMYEIKRARPDRAPKVEAVGAEGSPVRER